MKSPEVKELRLRIRQLTERLNREYGIRRNLEAKLDYIYARVIALKTVIDEFKERP